MYIYIISQIVFVCVCFKIYISSFAQTARLLPDFKFTSSLSFASCTFQLWFEASALTNA